MTKKIEEELAGRARRATLRTREAWRRLVSSLEAVDQDRAVARWEDDGGAAR